MLQTWRLFSQKVFVKQLIRQGIEFTFIEYFISMSREVKIPEAVHTIFCRSFESLAKILKLFFPILHSWTYKINKLATPCAKKNDY